MSYTAILIHVGFATKKRKPTLHASFDPQIEKILRNSLLTNGSRLIAYGAWTDHIHLFIRLSPTKSVSRIVADAKRDLKEKFDARGIELEFQDGYWAFSVQPRRYDRLLNYVLNQREKHGTGLTHADEIEAFEKLVGGS